MHYIYSFSFVTASPSLDFSYFFQVRAWRQTGNGNIEVGSKVNAKIGSSGRRLSLWSWTNRLTFCLMTGCVHVTVRWFDFPPAIRVAVALFNVTINALNHRGGFLFGCPLDGADSRLDKEVMLRLDWTNMLWGSSKKARLDLGSRPWTEFRVFIISFDSRLIWCFLRKRFMTPVMMIFSQSFLTPYSFHFMSATSFDALIDLCFKLLSVLIANFIISLSFLLRQSTTSKHKQVFRSDVILFKRIIQYALFPSWE